MTSEPQPQRPDRRPLRASASGCTLYVFMGGAEPSADREAARQAWPLWQAYIQSLIDEGRFVLSGSFQGALTGMTVFSAASQEEAESVVARDPMVARGFWRAGKVLVWNVMAGSEV